MFVLVVLEKEDGGTVSGCVGSIVELVTAGELYTRWCDKMKKTLAFLTVAALSCGLCFSQDWIPKDTLIIWNIERGITTAQKAHKRWAKDWNKTYASPELKKEISILHQVFVAHWISFITAQTAFVESRLTAPVTVGRGSVDVETLTLQRKMITRAGILVDRAKKIESILDGKFRKKWKKFRERLENLHEKTKQARQD